MKKLLNTLYVSDETAYLALEGETVICKSERAEPLRLPFANIEGIVCFSYLGCSPALMGKCVEKGVSLTFHAPNGKFLARVSGKSQGNVYTRTRQMEVFRQRRLELVRNTVAVKLLNTRFLLERSLRDHDLEDEHEIAEFSQKLKLQVKALREETDIEVIRGIEGVNAKKFFGLFNGLLLNKTPIFCLNERSKHPPLDATNALLSFLYAMMTNDIVSALEGVGLDSYIGFYHTLRPGRASLACDLIEEFRSTAERFVLSLINLKILTEKDFKTEISGAVYLKDEGRLKVLKRWQQKKRETIVHPVIKEKIPFGLLPFVQSNLLAKTIRGEVSEYPPFISR